MYKTFNGFGSIIDQPTSKPKMYRRYYYVEGAENGTVLACMNATGQYIPPFVLFKSMGKRDDSITVTLHAI